MTAEEGRRKLRRGESLTKMTAQEFYEAVQDECVKKAEKLTLELKMAADDLSHRRSPRSQRHSQLLRNVSSKMANHVKTDLENKIYEQLWEEANAAVFRNLPSSGRQMTEQNFASKSDDGSNSAWLLKRANSWFRANSWLTKQYVPLGRTKNIRFIQNTT